jgi:hypothetical protein
MRIAFDWSKGGVQFCHQFSPALNRIIMEKLMKKVLLVYMLITLFALPAHSQTPKVDPPPGKIELLPGYQHQTGRGIDTMVGKIWKEGGITITYDIGMFAGMYASPYQKDQYQWFKEQKINNHTVRIALTKAHQLRVTFVEAHASFLSVITKDEDLAEALLMILTYRSG